MVGKVTGSSSVNKTAQAQPVLAAKKGSGISSASSLSSAQKTPGCCSRMATGVANFFRAIFNFLTCNLFVKKVVVVQVPTKMQQLKEMTNLAFAKCVKAPLSAANEICAKNPAAAKAVGAAVVLGAACYYGADKAAALYANLSGQAQNVNLSQAQA